MDGALGPDSSSWCTTAREEEVKAILEEAEARVPGKRSGKPESALEVQLAKPKLQLSRVLQTANGKGPLILVAYEIQVARLSRLATSPMPGTSLNPVCRVSLEPKVTSPWVPGWECGYS